MLKYRCDILEKLKACGYNTNTIRKQKLLGENQLQYIRTGKIVGPTAIDTICELLQCQPGDILEWIPNKDESSDS